MKARGVEKARRECGLCDAPGAHALARVAHAAVAPLVAAEEGGGGAVELVVVGLAGARVAGEREAYRDEAERSGVQLPSVLFGALMRCSGQGSRFASSRTSA